MSVTRYYINFVIDSSVCFRRGQFTSEGSGIPDSDNSSFDRDGENRVYRRPVESRYLDFGISPRVSLAACRGQRIAAVRRNPAASSPRPVSSSNLANPMTASN